MQRPQKILSFLRPKKKHRVHQEPSALYYFFATKFKLIFLPRKK